MPRYAHPKRTAPRLKIDWGAHGPAMAKLPSDIWRRFAEYYVTQRPGFGALAATARAAGVGGSDKYVSQRGWMMLHDSRMIEAVAELTAKMIRVGAPEAVGAIMDTIRDPSARDRIRACDIILARSHPIESRQVIDVTHRTIDPDQEALEEYRAAVHFGATRDKLIETFGETGLLRIEKLDAAHRSDEAKVIEGELVDAG